MLWGGVETLLVEGAGFQYASGYKSAILDNQTDAVMLSEAIYPSENPIKDSLLVPMFIYDGRDTQELSLMAYLNNDMETNRGVSVYPRYWHGYLVFLKPFFCLFDFADSRMFHLGFQMILFIAMLYWMDKRKLREYILPFTMVMLFWNPASTGICMQYYACFYVTMFCLIYMLWKQEWLWQDSFRYHMLFLTVGICTSYFDFLTYPIVTLGMPLSVWLLSIETREHQWKHFFLNSVFWVIGYIGMWSEKWILSSVVLGENVVADAIRNVMSRTSVVVDAESISRVGTIVYLFQSLLKWPYVIFFGGTFIGTIYYYLKVRSRQNLMLIEKSRLKDLLLFLGIAIFPCVWFFLAANHSYVHPRLVYRVWGISIFTILSGVVYLFKVDKDT